MAYARNNWWNQQGRNYPPSLDWLHVSWIVLDLLYLKQQWKKGKSALWTGHECITGRNGDKYDRINVFINTWWQFKVTNASGLWRETRVAGKNPSTDGTSKLHPGRGVTALNTAPPHTAIWTQIKCLKLLQVVLWTEIKYNHCLDRLTVCHSFQSSFHFCSYE